MPGESAEQQARDLLERMGIEEAQSFSSGDVVELANLIAGISPDRTANALERIADCLENPLQSVNVGGEPTVPTDGIVPDELDPTFAALAGTCYAFADQLEKAVEISNQFDKAKELRNMVSRTRKLADQYAENAKAEDYRHQMNQRILLVSQEQEDVDLVNKIKEAKEKEFPSGFSFASEEPWAETSTDPRYQPKGAWKPPDSP